jgi:hypothetical protein
VFDTYTVNNLDLKPSASDPPAPPSVDLRSLSGAFSAEFMLDDFVNQPKHDVFRIRVSKDQQLPSNLEHFPSRLIRKGFP